MNGIAYRILRKTTMLRTFQMALVYHCSFHLEFYVMFLIPGRILSTVQISHQGTASIISK